MQTGCRHRKEFILLFLVVSVPDEIQDLNIFPHIAVLFSFTLTLLLLFLCDSLATLETDKVQDSSLLASEELRHRPAGVQ